VRRDVILDLTPPPQVAVRPRFPWGPDRDQTEGHAVRTIDVAFAVFIGGAMFVSGCLGALFNNGPAYRRGLRDGRAEHEHIRDIHALCQDQDEPAAVEWPRWGNQDLAELPAARRETVRAFARWVRTRLRRPRWTRLDITGVSFAVDAALSSLTPTPPPDVLAERGLTIAVVREESVRAVGRARVPRVMSVQFDAEEPVKIDRTVWTEFRDKQLNYPGRRPARHAAEPDEPGADPLTDSGVWFDIVSRLEAMGAIDPLALPCSHCDTEGPTRHRGCPGCACGCTLAAVAS